MQRQQYNNVTPSSDVEAASSAIEDDDEDLKNLDPGEDIDDCSMCLEMVQIAAIVLHGTAAMYFSAAVISALRRPQGPSADSVKYTLALDAAFFMSFGAYYYWYWYGQIRSREAWKHRMRKSAVRSTALTIGCFMVMYGVSCIGDLLLY